MKKISTYIIVLCITICTFIACKKMDSTYKKFIVPGGLVYPGKATSAKAYSGLHRIKIAWLRGSDPNVTKARIFWDNYADSVEIKIPPTGDIISYTVENLEERPYSFVVKTYDAAGRVSIPVELFGNSYGDRYQTGLLSRPVNTSEVDLSNTLTIVWRNANITGGAYATDVKYTDQSGHTILKRFRTTQSSSTIPSFTFGSTYQYRTVYVPDTLSIDTFYTEFIPQRIASKLSKANWIATADSYAVTSQLPNGAPQKAIDDDINTFWHTHHTPAPVPPFPHWLAVDMKTTYNVTRVELTCRPGVTNTFTAFTMQGSNNGTDWTSYDSFTLAQQDPTQSFILTGTPLMRYIRIYATAGPNAYANLAEFSVYGYPAQP